MGIKAKDNTLDLQVNPADDLRAKNLLAALRVEEKDLVIGISPGAGGSWGREAGYKHWPALKFAQVADRLINQLKAKVILFGDDTEHPIADIIINAMRNKPIDLTGKIGLDLLPAVINNLELFICNDGGPMHIAVALGVKTVSIFGPVSEVVYGPYPDRKNHVVLAWGGACRPCYRNFRMPPCERDKECLRSIGVDDVCASAEKLIKG